GRVAEVRRASRDAHVKAVVVPLRLRLRGARERERRHEPASQTPRPLHGRDSARERSRTPNNPPRCWLVVRVLERRAMGRIGVTELLLILGIALLLFGPSKLADMGKGLSEGLKNFKKGLSSDDDAKPPEAPRAPP